MEEGEGKLLGLRSVSEISACLLVHPRRASSCFRNKKPTAHSLELILQIPCDFAG